MNSSNNAFVLDNYWGLTKGLSRENKIKLVARLTKDIEKEEQGKRKEDLIDYFFGSFQSDKQPEELIEEIRRDRYTNREISFD